MWGHMFFVSSILLDALVATGKCPGTCAQSRAFEDHAGNMKHSDRT